MGCNDESRLFFTASDAHSVKIHVDQGLWQVQILNMIWRLAKDLDLHPMDENPRRHEQV